MQKKVSVRDYFLGIKNVIVADRLLKVFHVIIQVATLLGMISTGIGAIAYSG